MARPQKAAAPKRRKMPKSVLEKNDHELMEAIVGKRVMRRVDAILNDEKGSPDFMK